MSAESIIDDIIRREGGYVDNPNDRGGPTNYGITQETLADWRGHPVSAEDVQALTESEARDIYLARYYSGPGYDHLAEPLRSFMVDSAVQHGPGRATRWLQHALGTTIDGVIGPKTLTAYERTSVDRILRRVIASRAKFYGDIIAGNETQRVFAAGWFRRLAEAVESTA